MENTTNQEGEIKPFSPTQEKKHEKNVAMAVVAYIIFFVPLLTDAKDDPFVKYHIRQGFLLFVSWLLIYIAISIVFGSFISFAMIGIYSLFSTILNLGLFVLFIIGIIHAVQGEEKPLPLIGHLSDKVPF